MRARQAQRYLKKIGRVHTWQLVVIFVLSILLAAILLRINNIGMVHRRQAAIQADERGDSSATQRSLVELQRYVASHMNAGLNGGVYLENTYERDREAAIQAATSATNPNSAVYNQAATECQSRFRGGTASFRNDYVQCVVDRVGALSAASDPLSTLQLPRADQYRFDFVSPIWSPDAAGFSVLSSALILAIIVIRFISTIVLRLLLRYRYS